MRPRLHIGILDAEIPFGGFGPLYKPTYTAERHAPMDVFLA